MTDGPILYEVKKPNDRRVCCECRKPSSVVIGGRAYCKAHTAIGVGFRPSEKISRSGRLALHLLSNGGCDPA